jgi:non-canonical (house-cleaning) NTP pyrophosphatase
MKITMCGSMQFEREMNDAAKQLQALGYETEKPNSVEGHAYGEGQDLDEIAHLKQGFVKEHFAKIDQSEGILVVNCDKKGVKGYIGGNTLMEMTYAFAQGLDIYTLYDLPKGISYAQEIDAMMPVVLGGDIENLDAHVKALPTVYLSTESPVKHTAVGRGFRKAGQPVRTLGMKVNSGVNEQPQTIEETYKGATNRHRALKAKLGASAADYYVTIESGLHPVHKDHNVFGNTVIIIEKNGGDPKVGIDVDIEIPKFITDKVPSVYPDIGALVQQEFGSELKDPCIH